MTYACPGWEFAEDSHLFESAAPTKVLSTIGNLHRRTPTRELYVAFKIPYIHDFFKRLCRHQVEIKQNHANVNVRNIGQSEAQHRKHETVKLGGGQACNLSSV
jgi:hypothetical protein